MDRNKETLLPISYQTSLMKDIEEIIRDIESLDVNIIKDFWDPQKCREDLIAYLAIYLGVSQWDSSWDIAQKRDMCQRSLIINKQKGTLYSLKESLKSLNISCVIKEWWQDPKIEKGFADIILQENAIIYSEEQYKTIYRLIDEVKRLSLHINIKKQSAISGDCYLGGGNHIISKVYIE